jgi:hypothetical protein
MAAKKAQSKPASKTKRKPGRPKGSQNADTKALRDVFLSALATLGGERWIVQQATKRPDLMFTALGRLLPKEVTGAAGGPMTIKVITGVDRGDGDG